MAKKPVPDDPQSCASCKCFLKNQHDEYGYCRHNPPTPIPADADDGYDSVLPVVEASFWCAQWIRKLQS